MGIFEIADPSRIEALYAGWPETFIWSFLQGYMGFAWADHPCSPRSAKIMAGDFCLFAGKPNVDLILHRPKGKAALYQGTPVAGASSYTVYRGGIEIEIDTRVDFRRQGLATACGARLILNCLERGLYPSWDAHSRASLSLAEKLGYKLDRPYPAYEYTIGSPAPTVQSAGAMR